MNGRATADIIDGLRNGEVNVLEAADRLAELDAELTSYENWRRRVPHLIGSLPPCPTCGGDGRVWGGVDGHATHRQDCSDCIDGKVSVEQLAATYRAVWDDRERRDGGLGERDGSDFVFSAADLRSVKP